MASDKVTVLHLNTMLIFFMRHEMILPEEPQIDPAN
jgi:hypothetical protein